MFTGIIEETGSVSGVQKKARSARVEIAGHLIFEDLKAGDSVAVNGVCLTAAEINCNFFTADIMNETLERSNLAELAAGSRVNLERAMPCNGRFGGHIVTGHIDGIGRILQMKRDENAVWITISAPPAILKYIIVKGSVAIDGISLTVAKVDKTSFAVSLIPHTARTTTLLDKKRGASVNLENDILGKYAERFQAEYAQKQPSQGKITREFLAKAGY